MKEGGNKPTKADTTAKSAAKRSDLKVYTKVDLTAEVVGRLTKHRADKDVAAVIAGLKKISTLPKCW